MLTTTNFDPLGIFSIKAMVAACRRAPRSGPCHWMPAGMGTCSSSGNSLLSTKKAMSLLAQ